ncbi:zinc finger protein 709 [Plutella xylostella]|uniref:zinc finger protein 709 n=1 Tax=Plutella xylostella TaxID=51655 RepID=UPI002032F261|nr:zinc finger protein 709 [Plutella xylostella]XP_011560404.3 zinc finger protein 709 [Plutella xylostella]
MENSWTEKICTDLVKVEMDEGNIGSFKDEPADYGNNMMINANNIKTENHVKPGDDDDDDDSKYEAYNFLDNEIDIKEEPLNYMNVQPVTRIVSEQKKNKRKHKGPGSRSKKISCPICNILLHTPSMKGHLEKHKSGQDFHCIHCPYRTTTKSCWQKHLLEAHNFCVTQAYKCTECDYSTDTRQHLTSHLRKHSTAADHKCAICDFATKHPVALRRHMAQHYSIEDKPIKLKEKRYECTECDYVTKHRHALKSHVAGKHSNVTLECNFCEYETKYTTSLHRHTKMQHKDVINETSAQIPKSFKCELCSYQSFFKQNLMSHLKRHVTHACNMCSYECTEQSALSKHMEEHSKVDTYQGLEFIHVQSVKMEKQDEIKPELDYENKTKKSEKKLQCEHCEYSTTYKNALKIHQRKHDTVEPTKCDHCEYTTKYPTSMRRHIVIRHLNKLPNPDQEVTGLTDYKCEVCDYKTYYENNLKKHMRKHSVDKPYKCELCSYETAYQSCFRKHEKSHGSGFQCDKCAFNTKHEGRMSWHLQKIHKQSIDNAHKCPYCDFSTKNKFRLTIHKQRSLQTSSVKCLHCEFESLYKCEIRQHKTKHYNITGAAIADVTLSDTDLIEPEKNGKIPETIIPPEPTEFLQVNKAKNKETDYQTHFENQILEPTDVEDTAVDWKSIPVTENRHEDKPFSCKNCPYSSRFKASVQRHFQRHHLNRARPFQCKRCPFSTSTKDSLALHIKRSTLSYPMACHCKQMTTLFKCEYLTHQKLHNAFRCSLCPYSCRQKYDLEKHHLIHTGSGMKCRFCDYTAVRKQSLLCHEATHTGDKPYKCTECEYGSIRLVSLENHMKRSHSGVSKTTELGIVVV